MFDLHCHILPGADDGAETLQEALEMAYQASLGGTRGIVATPHANLPGEDRNLWTQAMLEEIDALQDAIYRMNIPVQLYTGQEIFLTEDVPQLLAEQKLLSINRTGYVLTELDFQEDGEYALYLLNLLRQAGYIPILAHPERYDCIREKPQLAQQIKKAGCLLQINSGSLTGLFGNRVRNTAHLLCRYRLADVVASDGHRSHIRTPDMQESSIMLADMYSEAYAKLRLQINPYRILCDDEIAGYVK